MALVNILSTKTTTTTVSPNDVVYVGSGVDVSVDSYAINCSGAGSFKIYNHGSIFATQYAIDGNSLSSSSHTLSIVNYADGVIASSFLGVYSADNIQIVNHGLISGGTYGLYGGRFGAPAVVSTIYNDGTIEGGTTAILLSNGQYSIENAGIIRGYVTTNGGNDSTGTFNSTNGSFDGTFEGYVGADTVIGGQVSCTLLGEGGNDVLYANPTQKAADNRAVTTLDGGLGNNALYGGGAFTTFVLGTWGEHTQVWGGKSLMGDVSGYLNNTAQFSNATQGVYVDLLNGHNAFINDSAGAWDGSGVFADWIVNVPNITGSAYGDVIQADGTGGKIAGAGGADALYGATGADTFAFTAYSDSNTVTGYDTVVNFQRGTDKIDISGFMAANGLGAASLVLAGSGNSTTVYVERVAGTFNSATDLAFVVNSTAGVLTAADFVL